VFIRTYTRKMSKKKTTKNRMKIVHVTVLYVKNILSDKYQ